MKRVLLFTILLGGLLFGETMHATYKIEYGIFGKMGVSDAYLTKKDGRYEIKMVAKATGLAKVLSGGRVEVYSSKGEIIDGALVPKSFSKQISRSNKKRVKIYTFDHKLKKITFYEENFQDGRLKDKREGEIPYYAKNDILSLYFNISSIIGSCKKPFSKELKAVGAEKNTGRVKVETVVKEEYERLNRYLKDDSCYLKVTIFQKLFGSKGGELYLSLNDNFIVTKALLKDVVMFGDVRGEIVEFRKK